MRTEKEIKEKINNIEGYRNSQKAGEQIKMTLKEFYWQQIHMLKWALGEEK
jgi:hypothetical protein